MTCCTVKERLARGTKYTTGGGRCPPFTASLFCSEKKLKTLRSSLCGSLQTSRRHWAHYLEVFVDFFFSARYFLGKKYIDSTMNFASNPPRIYERFFYGQKYSVSMIDFPEMNSKSDSCNEGENLRIQVQFPQYNQFVLFLWLFVSTFL